MKKSFHLYFKAYISSLLILKITIAKGDYIKIIKKKCSAKNYVRKFQQYTFKMNTKDKICFYRNSFLCRNGFKKFFNKMPSSLLENIRRQIMVENIKCTESVKTL